MIKRTIAVLALALAACSPPAPAPTEETPPATVAANPDLATVTTPASGARVTSPLAISGVAPANWYFENQFPVHLEDAQGNVIANGPATPRVNWTENALPKEYDASLTFTVTADTPATLVLQEDMPREDAPAREVRVPVVLTR